MSISNRRLSFPDYISAVLQDIRPPIFITGASGWLGQALLEMCESCFGDELADIVTAFASKPGQLGLRSGRKVNLHALDTLPAMVKPRWLLCHLAFLGKEKVAELGEAAFVEGNKAIRKHVDTAIAKAAPEAIFYASSGAAYDTSHPYGEMKAKDEEYFAKLGIKYVIPRIFNISGPYVNKWQAYALSNLIIQGYREKSLKIMARHAVIRSYTHVEDVLGEVFSRLLIDGKARFDATGDEELELQELAQIINEVVFDNKLPIIREGFDPKLKADRYVGKPDMQAKIGLREQIRDTADYLARYSAS